MGTWGTAIKDNDAFADIYSEFFERYNDGEKPNDISRILKSAHREMLNIEEEKHCYWFAFALAQWETKSLEAEVLSEVQRIILSGDDLKLWATLDASAGDLDKRGRALTKFLEKITSEKPKAKSRRRLVVRKPVFLAGDCLVFKMTNGNFGGAVVLAADSDPKSGSNLIATTRLNQPTRPTLEEFEKADVLLQNIGEWKDHPDVAWYLPNFFHKRYASLYELIGRIRVDIVYSRKNYTGEGYLFKPSWTGWWFMNVNAEHQFAAEENNPKPKKTITIKELTKKGGNSITKFLDIFRRK